MNPNSSDNRNPQSTLTPDQLNLFHRILTVYESGIQPKAKKDFRSSELKRLMKKHKKDLNINDAINSLKPLNLSEIRFKNNKNKATSLISNIRHAFAHNRIALDTNNNNILIIENIYRNKTKLKARIKYGLLKELMETILGDHNLTEDEKKKKRKKNNFIHR